MDTQDNTGHASNLKQLYFQYGVTVHVKHNACCGETIFEIWKVSNIFYDYAIASE